MPAILDASPAFATNVPRKGILRALQGRWSVGWGGSTCETNALNLHGIRGPIVGNVVDKTNRSQYAHRMALKEDITLATRAPEFSGPVSIDPRSLGTPVAPPLPPPAVWEPIDDRTWLITEIRDGRIEASVWDVTNSIAVDGRLRTLTADLVRPQTVA